MTLSFSSRRTNGRSADDDTTPALTSSGPTVFGPSKVSDPLANPSLPRSDGSKRSTAKRGSAANAGAAQRMTSAGIRESERRIAAEYIDNAMVVADEMDPRGALGGDRSARRLGHGRVGSAAHGPRAGRKGARSRGRRRGSDSADGRSRPRSGGRRPHSGDLRRREPRPRRADPHDP